MPDGSRPGRGSIVTAANGVTFGRLCAVPVAFWMVLDNRTGVAFIPFVAAGLTDALDGWLARRYGSNALGALTDPVADKALLVTMFITPAAIGALPDWVAIPVVFRDLLIIGGVVALNLLGHPPAIRPLYISKLNTVMQILLVGACLRRGGFAVGIAALIPVMIWSVAATTLVSGAACVRNTARGD